MPYLLKYWLYISEQTCHQESQGQQTICDKKLVQGVNKCSSHSGLANTGLSPIVHVQGQLDGDQQRPQAHSTPQRPVDLEPHRIAVPPINRESQSACPSGIGLPTDGKADPNRQKSTLQHHAGLGPQSISQHHVGFGPTSDS